MMKADLHMHTTSSDGVLSPAELVAYAAKSGVTLMAVTDHDTFAGADQLRGVQTAIPVLTGIELSMADMHGLHLLGYGLGEAAELRRVVDQLAHNRLNRARRMVEKLGQMGYPLDYDAICAAAGEAVGRPHIARAMVAAGYISAAEEAFRGFIGDDDPAYVPSERLTMKEALPLLRRNGFVPVMAHPAEILKDDMTLRTLIAHWQQQGLRGVEVYHPSWEKRGYASLDAMVRRMGLLVTGGSDYHCEDDRHGRPGCTAAYWQHCAQDVAALQAAMRNE